MGATSTTRGRDIHGQRSLWRLCAPPALSPLITAANGHDTLPRLCHVCASALQCALRLLFSSPEAVQRPRRLRGSGTTGPGGVSQPFAEQCPCCSLPRTAGGRPGAQHPLNVCWGPRGMGAACVGAVHVLYHGSKGAGGHGASECSC